MQTDTQRLLGIIETAVGDHDSFNDLVRAIFSKHAQKGLHLVTKAKLLQQISSDQKSIKDIEQAFEQRLEEHEQKLARHEELIEAQAREPHTPHHTTPSLSASHHRHISITPYRCTGARASRATSQGGDGRRRCFDGARAGR